MFSYKVKRTNNQMGHLGNASVGGMANERCKVARKRSETKRLKETQINVRHVQGHHNPNKKRHERSILVAERRALLVYACCNTPGTDNRHSHSVNISARDLPPRPLAAKLCGLRVERIRLREMTFECPRPPKASIIKIKCGPRFWITGE